ESLSDVLVAFAGGAVGGVFADVDTISHDRKHDAFISQALAALALFAVAAIDRYLKLGVCEFVAGLNRANSLIAGAVIVFLYLFGFLSPHRTFTHSILATALFSGCFALIYTRMGFSVLVGCVSHLALDLITKKEVHLFYPIKKGVCLRLCYSGKTANKLFMRLGAVSALALLAYRLYPYVLGQ
ncbi:MAG: metal-dependent hydrolase, partial [Clostridia bacterium]|nr:metal-dependent hydrolase [Clostridia bacterium]